MSSPRFTGQVFNTSIYTAFCTPSFSCISLWSIGSSLSQYLIYVFLRHLSLNIKLYSRHFFMCSSCYTVKIIHEASCWGSSFYQYLIYVLLRHLSLNIKLSHYGRSCFFMSSLCITCFLLWCVYFMAISLYSLEVCKWISEWQRAHCHEWDWQHGNIYLQYAWQVCSLIKVCDWIIVCFSLHRHIPVDLFFIVGIISVMYDVCTQTSGCIIIIIITSLFTHFILQ